MEKSNVKSEIERRFLLKGLPKVVMNYNFTKYNKLEPVQIWSEEIVPMPSYHDIENDNIIIEQYYGENRERYRQVHYTVKGQMTFAYFITKKKRIGPGHYEEDERQISPREFYEAILTGDASKKKPKPYIVKRRFLIYGELADKVIPIWEIDMFIGKNHLVIAEVELNTVHQELVIPDFIQDVLLMEVTTMDQFLNSRLAGLKPMEEDVKVSM